MCSTNVSIDSRAIVPHHTSARWKKSNGKELDTMSNLVTLSHAAQQLGVSLAALRDWRFRRKHLDFVKVGRAVRVLQASIDKFIERRTVTALGDR